MAVEAVAVAARHLHGGVGRFRRPRGEVVAEEGGEEESVVRVKEQPVVRRGCASAAAVERSPSCGGRGKVQRFLGVFAALGGLGVEELGRRALELLSEEQHREDVDGIAARPILFVHLLLKLLESPAARRRRGRRASRGGGVAGVAAVPPTPSRPAC